MPRKAGKCADAIVLSYNNKIFIDIVNPKPIKPFKYDTDIMIKHGKTRITCKIVRIEAQ
jgi:hypothetical protein